MGTGLWGRGTWRGHGAARDRDLLWDGGKLGATSLVPLRPGRVWSRARIQGTPRGWGTWGSGHPRVLTQWWRPIQTLSSSSLRWNLAMNLATAACSSGLCREARWQPAWITLHQAWGGGNRLVRGGGWGLPGQ